MVMGPRRLPWRRLCTAVVVSAAVVATAVAAAVTKGKDDGPKVCGPGLKCSNAVGPACSDIGDGGGCITLANEDVIRAVHWLADPPKVKCAKVTTVQGIDVCEDGMKSKCLIWSMVSSMWCDEWGDLEFEKTWSKRCDVTVFHFTPSFKGNTCAQPEGRSFPDYPRLTVKRADMWGERTFNGFYKIFPAVWATQKDKYGHVDVFKVHKRGGREKDEFDGVQVRPCLGGLGELRALKGRLLPPSAHRGRRPWQRLHALCSPLTFGPFPRAPAPLCPCASVPVCLCASVPLFLCAPVPLCLCAH